MQIQVMYRLYMFLYAYVEQNCLLSVCIYFFRKNERTGTKKRQAKATSAQIDYMVDYFVQHPHVATGKFQSLHGNADLRGSWEQLVAQLNSMGKGGKTKDIKSWKSTWRDNKTAVSQKVAKIRANQVATGNVGGPPNKLTEREKKILGLMGLDYVEGVQCPDSFPDEQAEAMNLLAAGDEGILNIIPEPLTLRNSINDVTTEHDINCIDYEVLDDIGDSIKEGSFNVIQTHSQIKNVETAEHHREITKSPSGSEIYEGTTSQSLTTVTQGSNRKRKAPQITRLNGWAHSCRMPEKILGS
ncbi:PREDICTED: uncharacterized protein LOC105556313 [Vollenhovia emeryi]|uniref:uncharacterized protein LOC105556313 n=1 Tax=Vollenhovia emeryi TaxID=411798 RepID=UPI0005F4D884|nr:PREDICTED: uncharacterized protein LOC105556313 [Vollenhovia emeryi]